MKDLKTAVITSSHGSFTIDITNGKIIEKNLYTHADPHMYTITQFDIKEFCRFYGYTPAEIPNYIDILDLGYSYLEVGKGEAYEEPDLTFRDDVKENMALVLSEKEASVFKPAVMGEWLYRDGANYKFTFEAPVPNDMQEGDETEYEKLGFTRKTFHELIGYNYDDETDHNIVTLQTIKNENDGN